MEATENPSTSPMANMDPVTFSRADTTGVTFPHHDPLIITAEIAHCEVAQVFVDGGSSVNIIFLGAFRQLGVHEGILDQRCLTLVAFGGSDVQPLGHMHLTLSVGLYPRQASTTTDFVVAECPSSYNVILGHPAIGDLNLSINMRALLIRFPTPHGVGSVRGDQESARLCYASSVKLKTKVTYEVSCANTYLATDPITPSMMIDPRGDISPVNPQ